MTPAARPVALEALEPRDVPAHLAAVGADAGAAGTAQLYDAATGTARFTVTPFGADFAGGIRVAVGDATGDTVPDLIAAPGAGGGPVVKVFDGVTGAEVVTLAPPGFDPAFRGGLYVAAADFNLDGVAEVVVGAGEGGGPLVAVLDARTGAAVAAFAAFGADFRGGVRVAAGDVDGDGRADVVAAAGPGGDAHVKAFALLPDQPPTELLSTYAYAPGFAGGVYVACADVNADGLADVVTGAGIGGGPHVRAVNGTTGAELASFYAAAGDLRSGVRVATIDGADGTTCDIAAVVPTAGGNLMARFAGDGSKLTGTDPAGGWAGSTAEATADAALLWNQVALRIVTAGTPAPPLVARNLAIVHAAVFDAVNAIRRRYTAYHYSAAAPAGADAEAAALAAGDAALAALFPASAAAVRAVRDARLALIPDGPAKADGIAVGVAAAADILALRAADGAATAGAFPYTPGSGPGDWVPAPPANAAFALPGWGNVTPFAVASAAAYRPAGPPALTSPEYAAALDEVQRLGSATSTERTADQTEVAIFWRAGGKTNTPPGMSNAIAQQVVRRENLDLLDSARVFALVNLATADAGIVAWNTKLAYEWWRPITAIRNADADGNPATTADPAWTPLIPTPNHPDYTSGHSTFSAAAAAVLQELFGTGYGFRTYSQDVPGVSRAFDSFQAAAAEAGMSRIYGGIHVQYANQDGLSSGRAIGQFVTANFLRPV